MATLIRPIHPSHWAKRFPMETLVDGKELFVFNPDKWVYEHIPNTTWEEYIVGHNDHCEGQSICVSNTDDDTPF